DLVLGHQPGHFLVPGRLADGHDLRGHDVAHPPPAVVMTAMGARDGLAAAQAPVFFCHRLQRPGDVRGPGRALRGVVVRGSEVAEHRAEVRVAASHGSLPSPGRFTVCYSDISSTSGRYGTRVGAKDARNGTKDPPLSAKPLADHFAGAIMESGFGYRS